MKRLLFAFLLFAPVIYAQRQITDPPECNHMEDLITYSTYVVNSAGYLVYDRIDFNLTCHNTATGVTVPATTPYISLVATGVTNCSAGTAFAAITPGLVKSGAPYFKATAYDYTWDWLYSRCVQQIVTQLSYCQTQACPGYTPIIIDFGGSGFDLTPPQAVTFDYTGNGQKVKTAWIKAGATNGFLALTAADGCVDTGLQLFGPSSGNGFATLATYDSPTNGGNGDGIIDRRDAIFGSLRVWWNKRGDGICTKDEIYTLPELGINSVDLHYKNDAYIDPYGNQFRYKTRMNPDHPDEVGKWAYDVIFVTDCNK